MHSTPEGRTQHNDDDVTLCLTHTHTTHSYTPGCCCFSREVMKTLLTVADPLDGAHGTLFLHLLTCFHHGSRKAESVTISFIFI